MDKIFWIYLLMGCILCKYLLPFNRLPFLSVDVWVPDVLLVWCSTIYLFLPLFPFAWGNIAIKVLLWLVSNSWLHVFFRSFMVSSLTFKSLIHFVFIFVCSMSRWSSFILRHVLVQFSNTICWLNCFFLLCIFLPQLL